MLLHRVISLPAEKLQDRPLDWVLTQDKKRPTCVDQGNWQEADRLFTTKLKAASSYAVRKITPQQYIALDNSTKTGGRKYNLGNALALSGEPQKKAMQAYETALRASPPSLKAAKKPRILKQQEQEQKKKENSTKKRDETGFYQNK